MEPEDYTFRYPLHPLGMRPTAAAPTEMIRAQLRNLLDLVVLCLDGVELKVDGFKLLGDGARVQPLFQDDEGAVGAGRDNGVERPAAGAATRQDARNVALYEPRIALIKQQLESILPLVALESEGEAVAVDGFRLRDLRQWVSVSSCDPAEVFEHLGTRCNCDCVFCYNKGTPDSFALQRAPRPVAEERQEVETRLRHFYPTSQRSLFLGVGSTCEILIHPHALKVLRDLRQKTDRVFRIPTNGATLRPEVIEELARLAPVYLDLSLNSASPMRRQRLMRDRRPSVAIDALPLLKRAGIPYSVVIVPWPLESEREMLDDLGATVAYAVEHDAQLIQISLPGYSRFFSPDKLFDRHALWSAIVERVQELRVEHDYPIVVMPGMYEENLSRQMKNVPEVIGIVKNSPAACAGVQRGDVIKQVGGLVVRNRPQARDLLTTLQQGEMPATSIVVRRGNRDVRCELDLASFAYPHTKATGIHLGLIFMGTGLRNGYLEQLRNIIAQHGAKRVLFLTSELVRPTFEQCLRESYFFREVTVDLAVPENRFLGGNICMGDLLVVDDFIACIKERVATSGRKPDLVVIPSSPFSLGAWGRDLTGRCYLDIERQTGVPVALLDCATIYD